MPNKEETELEVTYKCGWCKNTFQHKLPINGRNINKAHKVFCPHCNNAQKKNKYR